MRIALRLVALTLAGDGLLSLGGVLVLGHRFGLTNAVRFPGATAFTLANLLVHTVGSPVAAIQLWRCKSNGWAIGLIVFAVDLLFQARALLTPRGPGVHLPSVAFSVAFDLIGIIILACTWGARFKVSNLAVQQTGACDARPGC